MDIKRCNNLDRATCTMDEAQSLSRRIHGVGLQEAKALDWKTLKSKLTSYLIISAAIIQIVTNTYDSPIIEACVDLVSLMSNGIDFSRTNQDRFQIFHDYAHESLARNPPDDVDHDTTQVYSSVEDVPQHLIDAYADHFLQAFTAKHWFARALSDFSRSEKVCVMLPDSVGGSIGGKAGTNLVVRRS